MGKKRKVPGLNSSSTADISFILLIFFLITTSMDTDQGLSRTLPRPPEDEEQNNEIKVKERNILNIRINKDDYIMITTLSNDEYITSFDDITERAKKFILNETNDPNLPEVVEKNIDLIGRINVTPNHVISVQTDRGTSYGVYFQVQDALVKAYNELRDDLAKKKFNCTYVQCSDKQKKVIREVLPLKISEAEPKRYGKAV
jgi:biopolymer transport protein ExbD